MPLIDIFDGCWMGQERILETELATPTLQAACPRIAQLGGDGRLRAALGAGLGRVLGRQTLKVQLNAGGGGCFPLHFDSDRVVRGRARPATSWTQYRNHR
jgi:hypothetical protein